MEHLSVLIVGGHPADVFDCAGGTLAHYVEAGEGPEIATAPNAPRNDRQELNLSGLIIHN